MDWRYVAAPLCLLFALGLGVVIMDPWGLFLGYIAYGLAVVAVGLVALGIRWWMQARATGSDTVS